MKSFNYKKTDAFTSGESLGNPAASLFIDKNELTPAEMLQVGKRHKGIVSEVVFCEPSQVADLKLTYYSSECEVDFCGHGTIATMYETIKNDKTLSNKKEIFIETNKKGILRVKNQLQEEDAVYISAPDPEYLECSVSKEMIAKQLGFSPDQLGQGIAYVCSGLPSLLVPVNRLADEISNYPDEARLKEFCLANGLVNILTYCFETSQEECFVHTRVFAPLFGYLEDPATGSSNSALAYYLYKNNKWNGDPVIFEQGGNDRIFNHVQVMIENGKVLFGGKATLRVEGRYYL